VIESIRNREFGMSLELVGEVADFMKSQVVFRRDCCRLQGQPLQRGGRHVACVLFQCHHESWTSICIVHYQGNLHQGLMMALIMWLLLRFLGSQILSHA
jgi:hypothetical protein